MLGYHHLHMSLSAEYEKAVVNAFKTAEYQEIFGLNFSTETSKWTKAHKNVLLKFLKANNNQVKEAANQLQKTLEWRKVFKPLDAAKEDFSGDITKLGVLTKTPDGRAVTWNLYGAVKNPGDIFADTEKFVRWRVGLHERALALLDFSNDNLDSMDQVHDYMNVSFLRMDSRIKKASSQIIEMFQNYYPETLKAKYFVNVPYIMMWVFKLVRSVTSEATTSKFHVLANGNQLSAELGDWVPAVYGGKGKPLRDQEVKYENEDLDVE